jgi:hypothetical protein
MHRDIERDMTALSTLELPPITSVDDALARLIAADVNMRSAILYRCRCSVWFT